MSRPESPLSVSPTRLHCLHGFLGTVKDWRGLSVSGLEIQAHDLFALGASENPCSLSEAGARVNEAAREKSNGLPQVLLGYSLGARLALQALIQAPARWSAAIIVSGNPGLADPKDRSLRLEADLHKASRFRAEPWNALISDWDAQAVFCGRPAAFPRREQDFERASLTWALSEWSLGRQDDLRPALGRLSVPVLWVAGEEDSKYTALARECAALNPGFQFSSLKGAAHRVPWEAPELFQAAVVRFLKGSK